MQQILFIAAKPLMVMVVVAAAANLPYFGPVTSLIGAVLTTTIVVIIPCMCHYSTTESKCSRALNCLVIVLGCMTAVTGTIWAALDLVRSATDGTST